MFALRSLLAFVALVSLAVAQGAKIAFASVPAVVVAGQSYNITWGGGDGSSVTITLRQGEPNDLTTVGTLIDGAEGYSWVWNVSKSLDTASNYALQITQGQSDINYSGLFSIVGGSGTSSISYSGLTTATSNSTATMTAMNSTITGNATMTANNLSTTATSRSNGGGRTFGDITSTDSSSSPTAAATTSAPTQNAAAVELGSSAALVMGIIAAVMCLH